MERIELQEKIFNHWIALKNDIQDLATIVQNDIELMDLDIIKWEAKVRAFKGKIDLLTEATKKFVKVEK